MSRRRKGVGTAATCPHPGVWTQSISTTTSQGQGRGVRAPRSGRARRRRRGPGRGGRRWLGFAVRARGRKRAPSPSRPLFALLPCGDRPLSIHPGAHHVVQSRGRGGRTPDGGAGWVERCACEAGEPKPQHTRTRECASEARGRHDLRKTSEPGLHPPSSCHDAARAACPSHTVVQYPTHSLKAPRRPPRSGTGGRVLRGAWMMWVQEGKKYGRP